MDATFGGYGYFDSECNPGLNDLQAWAPVLNLQYTIAGACTLTLDEVYSRVSIAFQPEVNQWVIPSNFDPETNTLADLCAVTCQSNGVVSCSCGGECIPPPSPPSLGR